MISAVLGIIGIAICILAACLVSPDDNLRRPLIHNPIPINHKRGDSDEEQ